MKYREFDLGGLIAVIWITSGFASVLFWQVGWEKIGNISMGIFLGGIVMALVSIFFDIIFPDERYR